MRDWERSIEKRHREDKRAEGGDNSAFGALKVGQITPERGSIVQKSIESIPMEESK